MADKNDRTANSVPGAYYVDETCIGCELCVNTAPEVFAMNGDAKAYVKKQPAPEDLEDTRISMESCPVEAIGDDG